MKIFNALIGLLIGLSTLSLRADPLAVGATAPAVSAVDQDGKPVNLWGENFQKGTILLYFYPKAGTKGCTAEACSLRDSFTEIQAKGITVIGVSYDQPDAQKKFQTENTLPFTLIADTDHKVADAFGVPRIKVDLEKRQSFLIRDGKIVWEDLAVKPAEHTAEVLKACDSLPN